jgi:hypothetical protein
MAVAGRVTMANHPACCVTGGLLQAGALIQQLSALPVEDSAHRPLPAALPFDHG